MPNKDMSNWLVVSDIDGTLNNKFRQLPKRNFEAINRFVLRCNGHFTLASGRNVESLRKHYEKLPIAGTPAIILNGAGIYDYSQEKMLHYTPINQHAVDIVGDIYKRFPLVEIEIVTDKTIYTLNPGIFSVAMSTADKLTHNSYKKFEDIPRENWGKVIFLGLPPIISQIRKYVGTLSDTGANFMSSSVSSFEMLEQGVHKGSALLKIAEMYNIEQKHTAAIGDYFNDYDMLKTVNLSASCGQAPKALKAITKYHACHCNRGAVGDLLEYLMDKYEEDSDECIIKK
ncbi:MAG: Cof-type HAD-IIB family hydrolase [Oscillospiraceae bacterium]|nr:Cof-type HAD-IIB family hydrolase [Oscillospiraceae bacterium]